LKIVTSVPGELCRQIVGGGGHTLMLGHDGSVHGTGWNHVGQLGQGHTDPVTQFTKLDLTFCGDTKIVSLAAGWDFSLLLTEHGDVYSCGSNTFGQLGVNCDKTKMVYNFRKIESLKNISQVACGLRHVVCVDRDGHVFSWGAGTRGQLGVGKVKRHVSPISVSAVTCRATDVFCGQYFTLVKLASGEIVGFGDNKYQQLRKDENISQFTEPTVIENASSDDQISCGWTHVVINRGGHVSVRGRNNFFQHGTCTRVRAAVAGSEHCTCLTDTGQLVTWGWNEHGNCGLGLDQDCIESPATMSLANVTNVFVGSAHCFAITEE